MTKISDETHIALFILGREIRPAPSLKEFVYKISTQDFSLNRLIFYRNSVVDNSLD